jgi:hypothetical protein
VFKSQSLDKSRVSDPVSLVSTDSLAAALPYTPLAFLSSVGASARMSGGGEPTRLFIHPDDDEDDDDDDDEEEEDDATTNPLLAAVDPPHATVTALVVAVARRRALTPMRSVRPPPCASINNPLFTCAIADDDAVIAPRSPARVDVSRLTRASSRRLPSLMHACMHSFTFQRKGDSVTSHEP